MDRQVSRTVEDLGFPICTSAVARSRHVQAHTLHPAARWSLSISSWAPYKIKQKLGPSWSPAAHPPAHPPAPPTPPSYDAVEDVRGVGVLCRQRNGLHQILIDGISGVIDLEH